MISASPALPLSYVRLLNFPNFCSERNNEYEREEYQ